MESKYLPHGEKEAPPFSTPNRPEPNIMSESSVPEIIGMRHDAVVKYLKDEVLQAALDYDGVVGFLTRLEKLQYQELEDLDADTPSLVRWGLDHESAEYISSIVTGTEIHKSVGRVVLAYLAYRNNVDPDVWQPTDSGWPCDRPVNTVFRSWIPDMYYERHSLGSWPTKEKQIDVMFLDNPNDSAQFLPVCPPGRFLVFHGTDWDSTLRLEGLVELTRNARVKRDFGRGFYVTPSLHYAVSWAVDDPAKRFQGKPCLRIYSLPNGYRKFCRVLQAEDDRWYDILGYHRQDKPLTLSPDDYDMACGRVCQDAIAVNKCKKEPIPLGSDQICIKTIAGLCLLEFEGAFFYKARNF